MRNSRLRVAVFGGGPGGMTAAHELAERGFDVDLYERHDMVGGKARSWEIPGTGTDGRKGLPAELGPHGVPGGYRHLGNTLSRIPIGNGKTVVDNLTSDHSGLLFSFGLGGATLPIRMPSRGLAGLRTFFAPRNLFPLVVGAIRFQRRLSVRDELLLTCKYLAMFTSGEQRLWQEFEDVSVAEYFKADTLSERGQHFLLTWQEATTVPAERMNARTYAAFLLIVYRCAFERTLPTVVSDWLAPTNEAFFDPWADLLRSLGAKIHTGQRLVHLSCADGVITGATVRDAAGNETPVEADYYVLSVPPDKAVELMNDDILAADPALGRIANIEETWLGALQIYLTRESPELGFGGLPLDQPWAIGYLARALNSWDRDFAADYGDGKAVDYVSFDMANWDEPGIVYGKTAKECTPAEMFEEFRAQLRASFGDDTLLPDEDIHSWYLNPALSKPDGGPIHNDEPEFATLPGCWQDQPEAVTQIPNLFMAAAHVRGTIAADAMECANEAGRRAANGVLAVSGSVADPAYVADTTPPRGLGWLWALDDRRFRRGKRNIFDAVSPYRGRPKSDKPVADRVQAVADRLRASA